MITTNKEAFGQALSDWAKTIFKNILPQIKLPGNTPVANIMGNILGIDLSTYNPLDEFSFLAEPIVDSFIQPMAENIVGKLPDESVPAVVNTFLDSFITRAQENGSISFYGIPLEEKHFQNLKNKFSEYTKKVKKK